MTREDFTEFEWEVAQIGWPWCDLDAMIEDEDENGTVTEIIKHEAAKLLELAKKKLQPQLPANLDEAAEDFVWEVMENDENGISELSRKLRPSSKISDYYDALAEFFKAGAKWAIEQLKEK